MAQISLPQVSLEENFSKKLDETLVSKLVINPSTSVYWSRLQVDWAFRRSAVHPLAWLVGK